LQQEKTAAQRKGLQCKGLQHSIKGVREPDRMLLATGSMTAALCALQEIQGTVFGYDPHTDIVMIKEQGTHGGVVNLRLYKAAQLEVCSSATLHPQQWPQLQLHQQHEQPPELCRQRNSGL
jgi:hypothetical protein